MTDNIRPFAIQVNEERLKAWEEGKRLLADVGTRDMTAEENATWTRINEDIDRLDAVRDRFIKAETREQEAAALRMADERSVGSDVAVENRKTEAEVLRSWLRGQSAGNGGDWENPGSRRAFSFPLSNVIREQNLMRGGATADEARALAWDTGSVASGVPVTTARSIYAFMTASIALMSMPTYKFNTDSGEQMKFPRVNAHSIATQVSGQGTALAGTDTTFLSMTLDAWKYGELMVVANEVITDTGFDIVGFVSEQIGRAVGQVVDVDLTTGSGSGKPQGVMTAAWVGNNNGTIATGGSLITPTYENLVDLVYSVNGMYRARPSTAWLMRDLTVAQIRKLRDNSLAAGTSGQTMWLPSPYAGIQGSEPDRLLGYPVWTDPNVASCASNAKIIAFGDFSAYYIRTTGNFVLDRDESRYFDTDQTGFRGKLRIDGDTIDLTAVNLLKQSV